MVFAYLFTQPNFRIFSAPAHFALPFNTVICRGSCFDGGAGARFRTLDQNTSYFLCGTYNLPGVFQTLSLTPIRGL